MARANQTTFERFAQLVAAGRSQLEAFLQTHPDSSVRNGNRNSHRFAKHPKVQAHLKKLIAASDMKIAISREKAIDHLTDIITTPIGELNPNHYLAQRARPTRDGIDLQMPDKLQALAQLSKMQGWNEPEKHELSTTSELTALLETLRGTSTPISQNDTQKL